MTLFARRRQRWPNRRVAAMDERAAADALYGGRHVHAVPVAPPIESDRAIRVAGRVAHESSTSDERN